MSKVFKTLVAALLLGCVWVSCKESEGGAKSCSYRMNGRNIAEAEALEFISRFAEAREIKPEFISITDIRSDEDVE